MSKLKIAGIEFEQFDIDTDKLLFQVSKDQDISTVSIPLLGEVIYNLESKFIHNIVAAENELLIYREKNNHTSLVKQLENLTIQQINALKTEFEIEVCFELGEDWEFVCQHVGKTKDEIISEILKGKYPLINYGFQPGFMYLDNLEESLTVQRRDEPRLKVPAGSLAIGGKYIGIYGSESPGGWNLIGRSSHKVINDFDVKNFPSIGQEIRFKQIDKKSYLQKYGYEE